MNTNRDMNRKTKLQFSSTLQMSTLNRGDIYIAVTPVLLCCCYSTVNDSIISLFTSKATPVLIRTFPLMWRRFTNLNPFYNQQIGLHEHYIGYRILSYRLLLTAKGWWLHPVWAVSHNLLSITSIRRECSHKFNKKQEMAYHQWANLASCPRNNMIHSVTRMS